MTNISLCLGELNLTVDENKHLENIMCCFCKDLLKRPVVLNCGHPYCSQCLVTHLRSNSPNCILCDTFIPSTEDSVRPGTVINKVIDTIHVKLNCGCSTQLSSAKGHECYTTLKTPSPSKPIPQNVMEFVGQVVGIKMKQSSLPNMRYKKSF